MDAIEAGAAPAGNRLGVDAVRQVVQQLTDVDSIHHVALAATARRDGAEVLMGAAQYVVDAASTVASSPSLSTRLGRVRAWPVC